jgi:hypothetical protein
MSVQTKEFHARKIGQDDELVQVGDTKVENLTLADLKAALTTPTLGMEGHNVVLVFKRADSRLYRLPGEAMKVRILNLTDTPEGPAVPILPTASPATIMAEIPQSALIGSA